MLKYKCTNYHSTPSNYVCFYAILKYDFQGFLNVCWYYIFLVTAFMTIIDQIIIQYFEEIRIIV